MSSAPRVRIIHETNPRKYYPAIYELERRGEIRIVGEHRNSVAKEWVRSWVNDRKPFGTRSRHALSDLWLRVRMPFVHDEVVVLAFAPWDWRMLVYWPLVLRNRIVYHTSWPHWEIGRTPRTYGPLDRPLRWWWRRVLRRPSVHPVAVLDGPRTALSASLGIEAQVIPHAVEDCFYAAAAQDQRRTGGPRALRLVYVGELSAKKGIPELLELAGEPNVETTVIGDGPMRAECESAAARGAVRFLGRIDDRARLADELACHDVLVLLSRRQPTWEELFGIVLTEAMAAGLGVIATRHIGPESILGAERLGNLFDDGDLEGPRTLVRELAADRTAVDRFKSAHHTLSDAYRIDRVADQWRVALGLEPRDLGETAGLR